MIPKTFEPQGLVCPHPGAVYMFITMTFKDIFSIIKAKFYINRLHEGGTNVYIHILGRMTKMVTMPILGKNIFKIFS